MPSVDVSKNKKTWNRELTIRPKPRNARSVGKTWMLVLVLGRVIAKTAAITTPAANSSESGSSLRALTR